jgi:predicted TIM-barrel fold metal-dependent hydrolase
MPKYSTSWIDTHVHVGVAPEVLFEDLIAVLDDAGDDVRFIISPDIDGIAQPMLENPDTMLNAAHHIHSLVQHAPDRLYGALCVNPNFLNESLHAMDIAFRELGFVLLGEMLGYILNFDLNTDAGEKIVRKAVEYNVPIQIHLSTSNNPHQGHTSGIGQLEDIIGIAERVPEAKFILGHMIGMVQDNPPVVSAYLDLIENHFEKWPDNFWAEIADFHSPGVRMALERIPHNRLIAGMDWMTRIGPPFLPYGVDHLVWFEEKCPYEPSLHALIGFLQQWGATEEDIHKIAFTNAAELLKIN